MKGKGSALIVIVSQLFMVGLFFVTSFNEEIKIERYVSTIHNENLNKIANSVSLLFEEEIVPIEVELEDLLLEELPSASTVASDIAKIEEDKKDKDEVQSVPLIAIDSGKYTSNESMGFVVTEGNTEYTLSDEEFDVVVAVVAGEYDKNLNDALAVMSVILNRCDSESWSKWAGKSPYSQVIKAGQFEVYFAGYYLAYMPGGSKYGSTKYEVAKQAVIDGLNGIRNNEYLGFRAWYLTNYSSKYIVSGGNRYGYN